MKRAPASFSPRAARLTLAVALAVTPPLLAGALTRQGSFSFLNVSSSPPAGIGERGRDADGRPATSDLLVPGGIGSEFRFDPDTASTLRTKSSQPEAASYWMGCVDPTHGSTSSEFAFRGSPEHDEGVFSVQHGWILESTARRPSLALLDGAGSTGPSPHDRPEECRSATDTRRSDEVSTDSKGEEKQ